MQEIALFRHEQEEEAVGKTQKFLFVPGDGKRAVLQRLADGRVLADEARTENLDGGGHTGTESVKRTHARLGGAGVQLLPDGILGRDTLRSACMEHPPEKRKSREIPRTR